MAQTSPRGIPFRPDAAALTAAWTKSFVRAVLALGQDHQPAGEYCKANWPDDTAAHRIALTQRTAVETTSTSNQTMFSATRISSLTDVMGPSTAARAILLGAMPVDPGSYQQVWVPGISASASNVAFIKQASAIPVEQYDLSGGVMLTTGMKIGFISVLTREVMDSTNGEAVVSAKMTEDFALGFETLLLDATAASDTRPAGLRNGVNKKTATSGGGISALATDLGLIGGTVAAVGSNDIIFVASAKEAIRARCLLPAGFPYPIYPSGGLSDGTLVAIAPRALAVASGAPRLDVRREAVLHMSTTPTELLSTDATPGVVSFPVRDLLSTDCVAIRLICSDLCWGWRGAGIAWTDTVTW
jgi:hypothetical protein